MICRNLPNGTAVNSDVTTHCAYQLISIATAITNALTEDGLDKESACCKYVVSILSFLLLCHLNCDVH